MKWKYHLPHEWDRPRAVWEDVYLKPDVLDYEGPSLWLTVDALGDASDPSHGSDRAEFIREALEKLGDNDHFIDGADMIVRARDFTREELLGWVTVWLEHEGFSVSRLVPAELGEFAGTNEHAQTVAQLIASYKKTKGE